MEKVGFSFGMASKETYQWFKNSFISVKFHFYMSLYTAIRWGIVNLQTVYQNFQVLNERNLLNGNVKTDR